MISIQFCDVVFLTVNASRCLMDGLVFDLQNIIKIFIKEKNDKIEQIVQF